MDRFNREAYSLSERITADVCYHHITLCMRTKESTCDVTLLNAFRDGMTRSLNHMKRNGKIDGFELVCDWSNNSQDSMSEEEINLSVKLMSEKHFPILPIQLKFSRKQVLRLLEE